MTLAPAVERLALPRPRVIRSSPRVRSQTTRFLNHGPSLGRHLTLIGLIGLIDSAPPKRSPRGAECHAAGYPGQV